MNIKIVTDSSADLSAELAEKLGIHIVPLYVRFGEDIYRERVTLTDEEFYQRLVEGSVHPATILPTPEDFSEMYKKIADGADGILSIHLSSKLSGTYNSAVQAKAAANIKCPIEIVDSRVVSIALGLVVIAAAKAAAQGKDMRQLLEITREAMDNLHLLCLLDTLKYLQLGGRIGKAKALMGTLLNIKPIITLKDGEVVPAGQARSRAKGMDLLFNSIKDNPNIEELSIGYSTTLDDAIALSQRLNSLSDKPKAMLFRLGTTLGVHTGPGTIVISARGKAPEAKS